ncbi:MAG: diversity-generating retroelement protein Avd [bacterium]
MAQYNHLPIFQSAYRLTLEIYQAVHQFSREYKYNLGQKLKEIISDFLDLVVEANSKENKIAVLENARSKLEQLRIHLRLACDLKILGLNRYENFSRNLEEISKQLSGWSEWAKNGSFKK